MEYPVGSTASCHALLYITHMRISRTKSNHHHHEITIRYHFSVLWFCVRGIFLVPDSLSLQSSSVSAWHILKEANSTSLPYSSSDPFY